MKRILLAGIGLLLTNVAIAETWTFVTSATNDDKFYISRVQKSGNHVRFWRKTVFSKPTEDGAVESLTLWSGNCSSWQLTILSGMHMDAAGKPLIIYKSSKNEIHDVPPETVDDRILKATCKK